MRIVLTRAEFVELQEVALKVQKMSGVLLQEMGEQICQETLLKTDRELMDEVMNEAIKDIVAIGGSFVGTTDTNGVVYYIIDLPEDFMISIWRETTQVLSASNVFIVKAIRFANKYKNAFKKLWSYIRGLASTFGPIFEANEVKDIQKDFNELEKCFEETKANISKIAGSTEEQYYKAY